MVAGHSLVVVQQSEGITLNHSFENVTSNPANRFNVNVDGFVAASNAAAKPRPAYSGIFDIAHVMRVTGSLNPARFDDRQNTVAYAIALKNTFGDVAYGVFDLACRQSTKYTPEWTAETWASIKTDYDGNKLTFKSVEYWAAQDNATPLPEPDAPMYRWYTSSELAGADFDLQWDIEGVMVSGQPLILGGSFKTLKSSMVAEGAIALATGGLFLNKYQCNKRKVAVMSGESGLPTIQNTAKRIAHSKGVELEDLDIIWTEDLPRMGDPVRLNQLSLDLKEHGVQVLFVDPAYMTMPGKDAANLIIQGELLASLNNVCKAHGITLVLAHHVTRAAGKGKKDVDLADLAWSGFSEFARQWWIITRREKYVDGTGEHRLSMKVGGSMGHSLQINIDIREGVYPNRVWELRVQDSVEAHREAERSKLGDDVSLIIETLQGNEGMMIGAIQDAAGLGRGPRWKDAWAAADKYVERVQVERNGKKYPGYKLKQ